MERERAPDVASGPAEASVESARFRAGDVLDGYLILGRIAEGGCGEIYEAEHIALQRRVAIKLPHPDLCDQAQLARRFAREAQISARVRHPNLLVVHDARGLDDAAPYLVMELLTGETLSARLERGRLPRSEAIEITLQLLAAVSALGAQRIVHRDIKPANIMLNRDATGNLELKLIDFGVAKCVDEAETKLTQQGTIIGTLEYMAPEQLVGAAVDERTDVFACGLVLYELLTGKNPAEGRGFEAILATSLKSSCAYPRLGHEIGGAALADVLTTALQTAPSLRFQSAAAMSRALLTARSGRRVRTAWGDTARFCAAPMLIGGFLACMTVALRADGVGARAGIRHDGASTAYTERSSEPAQKNKASVLDVHAAERAAADPPASAQQSSAQTGSASPRVLSVTASRYYALALRALALGNYTRASTLLTAALKREPGHAGALRARVILAVSLGDRAAASSALAQYVEAQPHARDVQELQTRVLGAPVHASHAVLARSPIALSEDRLAARR